ncbi:hypothetical protein ACFQL1_14950 [Halomicroarcula sp. GCM10025709]|uniref:hypothetical protein n=1 Tax=Haloarcula TaxID=2237 RepID=UPI0024C4299B|nr:hypothetical protein [Halomicroarcula sp. YJ-61-S]
MVEEEDSTDSCVKSEIFGVNMPLRSDGGDMTKEDRRRQLLEFMKEHPLALPPLLIYRNLKLHMDVTFTVDSVRNYLDEFAEEGLVKMVEKEPLDDGDLVEAEAGTRPYYIITEEGRAYLED